MERSRKVLDMTQGKPVRMILAFAIPLFIGNIFQQVYSMVDTMVAGYCLGDLAIAAIGATSALYSLIISMSVGLNSGFAVVVTQSFGAHDEGKLRKAIGGMMVLDAAITVLLTVLSLVFLPALMRLMVSCFTACAPTLCTFLICCASSSTANRKGISRIRAISRRIRG